MGDAGARFDALRNAEFDAFRPAYASWGLRVAAAFLDGAIYTGAAFLLAIRVPPLSPLVGAAIWPSSSGLAPAQPWNTGWWIVVVVVIGVMEALLGASPGKLVVGIAVVGERDARPIGIVRTVARRLAHLFDTLLLIGYVRPLWNAKRQTFADSIVGTVVLRTRQPRQHRWFARGRDVASDPGPPLLWEAPTLPRWRPRATTAAAIVCVLGIGFSVGTTSDERVMSSDSTCSMTGSDDGPFGLTGGSMSRWAVHQTQTRLFVPRTEIRYGGWGATWTWSRTPPTSATVALRVVLQLPDGSSNEFTFDVADRAAHIASIDPSSDDTDLLGQPLSWSQTMIVDGQESAVCRGSITAES